MIQRGRRTVLIAAGVYLALALAAPLILHEVFGDRCAGAGWGLPSVWVRAVDARTGRPLPQELVDAGTITVRDGDVVGTSPLALGAALEASGTWDVSVRVPGYHEWRRSGVRVPERICGMKRARLTARLRRVRR